jgi:hypothetical protein
VCVPLPVPTCRASLADSNLCELRGKKTHLHTSAAREGRWHLGRKLCRAAGLSGLHSILRTPAGVQRRRLGGQIDCGRIAGLNRAAVSAYLVDVGADTNLCGSEKSWNRLGDRYSMARW